MQIKITKQFRWPISFVAEDGTDVTVTGVFREPNLDEVEAIGNQAKEGSLKQVDLVRKNLIGVEGVEFVDAEGVPMAASAVRDLFCSHTRYVVSAGLAYMEGLAGYRGKGSEKLPAPSSAQSGLSASPSANS
jgi:hypothetical protein